MNLNLTVPNGLLILLIIEILNGVRTQSEINNDVTAVEIGNISDAENTDPYYYAAVVEFYQERNFSMSAVESIVKTTEEYIQIIQDLRKNFTQPLDIIVFPESTLTDKSYSLSEISTKIPPLNSVTLCNSTDENYADFLKKLSCAAVFHQTVIIINFVEKASCDSTNCSEKVEYFNTNIALGPTGNLLARYRKFNLFGEPGITKPTSLDLPIFELKNTSFGMMICFDIQFDSPGLNLIKEKGVQNIIFPLRWISELPYLSALQTQQMWAQENDIVLLAAGANMPSTGAGGSGIFFGREGALQYDIFAHTGTKVFYQKVPIKSNKSDEIQANVTDHSMTNTATEDIDVLSKEMDAFFVLVDPSIKDHASVVLPSTTTDSKEITVTRQVCHGESPNITCCDFNISFSIPDDTAVKNSHLYVYHLVAFNGVRTYSGLYYGGIETCGLIACLNESVDSCGQRFPDYSEISWPITFHYVNITANFSQSDARVQFPTTLLSSMRPIAPQFTSWTKTFTEDGKVFRSHVLNKDQTRLLTFGIFGRDFSRDWDPIRNATTNLENAGIRFQSFWGAFIWITIICFELI